jgi:hypothetical protein
MSKDKAIQLDETEDFGFTFVDESELPTETDLIDLRNRLTALRKMFLPLLENLNKNPEKDMIKWPNRKAVLDVQIKKLIDLTTI